MGWFNRKNPAREIADAPDQERVRHELALFFGPNAERYLAVYEKNRTKPALYSVGWNWAVFFGSFVWFFYRRMYLWGALLIVAPIVLGLVFGDVGMSGAWAVMALNANSMYVATALGRIVKADQLGLSGVEREDYLRRAGGVSLVAGILALLLYLAVLALVIVTVFYPNLLTP